MDLNECNPHSDSVCGITIVFAQCPCVLTDIVPGEACGSRGGAGRQDQRKKVPSGGRLSVSEGLPRRHDATGGKTEAPFRCKPGSTHNPAVRAELLTCPLV